eukprot:TRINITY_DN4137_c0_g1_i3.p1 TRINITY_DN4137_c0_g1~~TRINITY_DN4137_c0_g1_i3.p1  ORF type:complete len:102 (-),score=24.33 TRINITY_DN4137_c0_g1_i3:45-350(-)
MCIRDRRQTEIEHIGFSSSQSVNINTTTTTTKIILLSSLCYIVACALLEAACQGVVEGFDAQASISVEVVLSHEGGVFVICLLYTSPSPRDGLLSRMPSSA